MCWRGCKSYIVGCSSFLLVHRVLLDVNMDVLVVHIDLSDVHLHTFVVHAVLLDVHLDILLAHTVLLDVCLSIVINLTYLKHAPSQVTNQIQILRFLAHSGTYYAHSGA